VTNGLNSNGRYLQALLSAIGALFVAFMAWLGVQVIDVNVRLGRIETTVSNVPDERHEALKVRDERIADLANRVARLEQERDR
jgi:hypothetical protein